MEKKKEDSREKDRKIEEEKKSRSKDRKSSGTDSQRGKEEEKVLDKNKSEKSSVLDQVP